MIDEKIANGFNLSEITVVTDCHITPEMAEQCYEILKTSNSYNELPVTSEDIKNKFHSIPDFCAVFMHKQYNKPVGFFIVLPFTESAMMRYIDDKLTFNTIEPADIEHPKNNGLFNLFFEASVTHKDYLTSDMARLEFSILLGTIIRKARNHSYCNYVLHDTYGEFSCMVADKMKLSKLKPHKYSNGLEGSLYGGLFDYSVYKNLPNYPTLEHAYNTDTAKDILKHRKDLWEEYKKLY